MTVWAEDEHRLGLLPVVRRVWAPRGQRPTAWVRRRDAWLDAFAVALAAFARDEGIGPDRRAVVALDGAGWHRAAALTVPTGIHLVPLPPASPELQPAERLWPLGDELVANHAFADLNELEAALVTRCQTLRADRRTITRPTHDHWWPREPRRQRNTQ